MKIRSKVFLGVIASVAFAVAVIFGFSYYFGCHIMLQTIVSYNTLLAKSEINSIDRAIYRRMERWQTDLRSDRTLLSAVVDSNHQFEAMTERDEFIKREDEGWKNFPAHKMSTRMTEIIESPLARELRAEIGFYKKKDSVDIFPELFVTNKFGALVVSTGRTSDYMQADEEWWRQAAESGMWISDVSFDQSTGVNALEVAIRIEDSDGDFIGVAKVIYDLRDVFGLVDEIVKTKVDMSGAGLKRETVDASLLTQDGKLIYSVTGGFGNLTDATSLFERVSAADFVSDDNGAEELYSHAHSEGFRDFAGLGWVLVIEKDVAEVLAPINNLVYWLILAMAGALAVALFLALQISQTIARPIRGLHAAVKRVEAGDWQSAMNIASGTDEVGDLARSFGQMVKAVKKSRAEIEEKVKAQTREIERKSEVLADQKVAIENVLGDVQTEKENAARERDKISLILQSIGDGVFVLDQDQKIIIFNEVAEKISGYSAAEALGKRYDAVLRFLFEKDENKNDLFIREAFRTGEIKQMANHTVLVRRDGQRIPVDDSAAPFKDKSGKVVGCVVVFRDVTHEREINRMKSEFVSVASHQLRTPLTGIKWFTELLLKGKLSAGTRDYVNQIAVSNERMVKLVDDLLNVSRIETGRKFDIVSERVDIVSIIKQNIEAQQILAKEKRVRIDCAPDTPARLFLDVDPGKISQVFQNLINNAYKYSKEGGRVVVGCTGKEAEVVFYVRDAGIGIPAAQQARIFEKFFRADNVFTVHTDGTGLGLYIVKAIVEAHGGRVWFESVENKGSTFYFSLPRQVSK